MSPVRSLALCTGWALAALAATPVDAPAAETWDLANEYNATSIHAEGDVFFADKLSESSNGAIEIVHHFGGALGYKSLDQFDAVGDGAIPIADTYVGPLGGIDPMFLLPSLPFLAKTAAEARALYDVAKPYYDEIFAANNQKLLYSSPWPPSGIWAKQPVASMAEARRAQDPHLRRQRHDHAQGRRGGADPAVLGGRRAAALDRRHRCRADLRRKRCQRQVLGTALALYRDQLRHAAQHGAHQPRRPQRPHPRAAAGGARIRPRRPASATGMRCSRASTRTMPRLSRTASPS